MKSLKLRGARRENGGVLITALVFAAVISLFALGVAMVATSHLNRGAVEADYASAIQLADAGINFELRHLSADTATAADRAHQLHPKSGQPGPHTVNLPDGASYTVSVMNDDGSGPWAPPNHLRIRSTGTVNGISRTVEITGQGRGIFDDFAIFAIHDGHLRGTESRVVGSVGTNGAVTFHSNATAETNIQGTLTYNGWPTDPNSTVNGYEKGATTFWNPDPVPWPTVEEIAAQLFPGGISHLRNGGHDNSRAMKFDPLDLLSTLGQAITVGITTGTVGNSEMNTFNEDRNPLDIPPVGRWHDGRYGLYRTKVLILPPGDYYFNRLNITNPNNYGILVDNAAGMVRIWVDDPTGTQGDNLSTVVAFTSTDKNKFRLFYNKCNTLQVSATFNGSIYAHKDGCRSNASPEIKLGGNSGETAVIRGSVIANVIDVIGNSRIEFPNNGAGSHGDDYILWYGFRNTWREVNPNGGAVFSDGTTR